MYGQGISRVGEIIDLGVDADIVKKSGAWHDYNGQLKAQGREPMKKVLLENPEVMNEIEDKIRSVRAREDISDDEILEESFGTARLISEDDSE